jgi:hypothetical protein
VVVVVAAAAAVAAAVVLVVAAASSAAAAAVELRQRRLRAALASRAPVMKLDDPRKELRGSCRRAWALLGLAASRQPQAPADYPAATTPTQPHLPPGAATPRVVVLTVVLMPGVGAAMLQAEQHPPRGALTAPVAAAPLTPTAVTSGTGTDRTRFCPPAAAATTAMGVPPLWKLTVVGSPRQDSHRPAATNADVAAGILHLDAGSTTYRTRVLSNTRGSQCICVPCSNHQVVT